MSYCGKGKHKYQQSIFSNEYNEKFRNCMSYVFSMEKLFYFGETSETKWARNVRKQIR